MSAPADDRPPVRGVEDRRRPAHGWGRLLVVVFAAFGLVVLVPLLVVLVGSLGSKNQTTSEPAVTTPYKTPARPRESTPRPTPTEETTTSSPSPKTRRSSVPPKQTPSPEPTTPSPEPTP